MEGKHTKIVINDDGDSKSINDTNTLSFSEQNNMTDKPCLGNNYNNNYDELAYPFSKGIKLKHEPEEAQVNKPVQYIQFNVIYFNCALTKQIVPK
jgi:hypothetical protein